MAILKDYVNDLKSRINDLERTLLNEKSVL